MSMKLVWGVFGALCSALFFCLPVMADVGIQSDVVMPLPYGNNVAYSSTWSIRTGQLGWASAQTVVTSATIPSVSFGDGAASTASLTVVSYTGLSTAAATGQLTMVSTTAAAGVSGSASVSVLSNASGTQVSITGPPGALNFMVGGNITPGFSSTNTAVNFATQVNLSSITSNITAAVNASSTVVTLTCVNAGTFCNSYAVTSTSPTAISTAAFSGGVNPVMVTVGFAQLMAVRDFAVGASTTAMASNLATAIAASSSTLGIDASAPASCPGSCGVVFATATATGKAGNLFPLSTTNSAAISTSAATMLGGQDNATLCINSICIHANSDFYPVTSNAQTATNIAAAFNASAASPTITAVGANAVVSATSDIVGVIGNSFTLTSSTSAATVSVLVSSNALSGSQLGIFSGGINSAYSLNGQTIKIPNHGLTTGLAVFYSTTTGNWPLSYTVSGGSTKTLTWGTSYYVMVVDANDIQLALTSTGSISGQVALSSGGVTPLALTFVSTATANPQDVFNLGVSSTNTTANCKLQWVVSNDNVNWLPYSTTSFGQTVPGPIGFSSGYVSTGTVNNYDFGRMNYGWLGLMVTAPTTGALNVKTRVIGKP